MGDIDTYLSIMHCGKMYPHSCELFFVCWCVLNIMGRLLGGSSGKI